jgi:hypothetical protein
VLGVAALLEKRPSLERAGALTALVLAGLLAADHVAERSRRRDARAVETADDALASLPPGALAFTPEWNVYSPSLGATAVAGRRADVLFLDLLLLRRGWYLDAFERKHPDRYGEVKAALDAYRTKLADWEEGRPYDGNELTRLYDGFTRALIAAAWKRGAPAMWLGTVIPEHLPPGAALVPSGIAYRILPSSRETAAYRPDAPVVFDRALVADLPTDDTYTLKIRPLYAGMLVQRALYEAAFSRRADAWARLGLALEIDPSNAEAMEVEADLLRGEGKLEDALTLYARAVSAGGDAARLAEKSRSIQAARDARRAAQSGAAPPANR